MHRKDGKNLDDVYENDVVRDKSDLNTTRIQSFEGTGNDCARTVNSRAALACLVLLCFLQLTAVIVLTVFIYTNNTNYTTERHQLLTNITNLTEEREQLLNNITKLTEEKKFINANLVQKMLIADGWTYYRSSFYLMFNDTKNWTESRRDCRERGADLVIINNQQEHDFVQTMSGAAPVWIGLTDSDKEGIWKWVDGTNLTSGFSSWAPKEPNSFLGKDEDCAVAANKAALWPTLIGWLDSTCNEAFQRICEINILQFP